MSAPKTMFDKVWSAHEVTPQTVDTPAVIFIDLHLTHEVTSPQAFTLLRERGLRVRRPDLTLATMEPNCRSPMPKVYSLTSCSPKLEATLLRPTASD